MRHAADDEPVLRTAFTVLPSRSFGVPSELPSDLRVAERKDERCFPRTAPPALLELDALLLGQMNRKALDRVADAGESPGGARPPPEHRHSDSRGSLRFRCECAPSMLYRGLCMCICINTLQHVGKYTPPR
eukprot:9233305-Pyramimonas_sp.AAC.2